MTNVDYYLKQSGGRRGCPHPAHRFARPAKSPAELVLPECAGQEAWLKARLDGIGGSEVGALIGVSEYENPFSVYNNKKEPPKDLSGVAAVEWGHRLEHVVAEKTAQEIGLVSRFGGGLWAMKDRPCLRVTPDRFATHKRSWRAVGVIECKTAGHDEHWESGTIEAGGSGSGSAPLSYQAQVQWQLGILGLPIGWLGCFVLGSERQFFTVEIKFNPGWFAEMAATAEHFWKKNILLDEPPLHDLKHPKTEELLKKLHPKVIHPSTDLPDDTDTWLADFYRAKLKSERAEEEFAQVKNYFRMMTGDAGAAYFKNKKVVSYPEVPSSRIDVEALKQKYPEIAQECTVTSSYRRMMVTVPKEIKKDVEGEDAPGSTP